MKNLLAIGLACVLPAGLAAEDAGTDEAPLGMTTIVVIDDAAQAASLACGPAAECMAFNRAVLTARTQKVSVLRSRGRWI